MVIQIVNHTGIDFHATLLDRAFFGA
jgi:hypothetical protein